MHKLTTLLLAVILCATTMSAAELTASDLDKRRKRYCHGEVAP